MKALLISIVVSFFLIFSAQVNAEDCTGDVSQRISCYENNILKLKDSGKTLSSPGTISFNDVLFTGIGGWDIVSNLSILGTSTIAAGSVTGSGNISIPYGSLIGSGTLSLSGGTTTIERSNTLGSTTPWTFYNLALGSGAIVGTTTRGDVATTTVSGRLTINAAHTLAMSTSSWNLAGTSTPLSILGVLNTGSSTVR
mgnify:CR=1 FL=1